MTSREAPRRLGATVWTNLWLVYILWGSTYLGMYLAIQTAPPLWAMGTRVVCSGLLLALVLAVTQGPRVLRATGRETVTAALLGAGMLCGGIGVIALAERYIPIGVAALLVAVSPMWGVFLRLITGDRPHLLTWLGVAVGLGGIALLVQPRGSGFDTQQILWCVLVVLGQLLWSLGAFLTPRVSVPRRPLVLVVYEMTFGGIALLVWSFLAGERVDLSAISASSWFGIVYLIFAGVVGYSAYTWLITHVPLSLAQTNVYVNPLVAALLGFAVLGQSITWALVLGGAVCLIGVALIVTGERTVAARR